MTPIEIVTIVLAVTIVVSVVVGVIVNKLRGKPACCSDCKGCPYHSRCARGQSAKPSYDEEGSATISRDGRG